MEAVERCSKEEELLPRRRVDSRPGGLRGPLVLLLSKLRALSGGSWPLDADEAAPRLSCREDWRLWQGPETALQASLWSGVRGISGGLSPKFSAGGCRPVCAATVATMWNTCAAITVSSSYLIRKISCMGTFQVYNALCAVVG